MEELGNYRMNCSLITALTNQVLLGAKDECEYLVTKVGSSMLGVIKRALVFVGIQWNTDNNMNRTPLI